MFASAVPIGMWVSLTFMELQVGLVDALLGFGVLVVGAPAMALAVLSLLEGHSISGAVFALGAVYLSVWAGMRLTRSS
jgi:hypothetical protein